MRSMAPMSTELGAPGRTVGLADAQHPGVGSAGGTPTIDQIREQLKSIADAPPFANQNKIWRFLNYIVEQTLAGNERRLKQYCIATEALGREVSFDPELDPVVRLEAGKLRKSLDVYYLNDGKADRSGYRAEGRIHPGLYLQPSRLPNMAPPQGWHYPRSKPSAGSSAFGLCRKDPCRASPTAYSSSSPSSLRGTTIFASPCQREQQSLRNLGQALMRWPMNMTHDLW